MSRWIDADEMLEYLDLMYEHQDDKDEPYNIGILGAINYIKHKAPSIDIVRCSECVYCNVQNTKYLYAICERHGIEFKPFEDDTRTHGCAWGSEKPTSLERSE